jgi:hypothetical protein
VLAYYAGGETEPKGLPFDVEPEIESEAGEFDRQIINVAGDNVAGDKILGDKIMGNKNVNQSGKYNINIDRADNLHIGDRISNPQRI